MTVAPMARRRCRPNNIDWELWTRWRSKARERRAAKDELQEVIPTHTHLHAPVLLYCMTVYEV